MTAPDRLRPGMRVTLVGEVADVELSDDRVIVRIGEGAVVISDDPAKSGAVVVEPAQDAPPVDIAACRYGDVVLDRAGEAWQRGVDVWQSAAVAGWSLDTASLLKQCGPLTLIARDGKPVTP